MAANNSRLKIIFTGRIFNLNESTEIVVYSSLREHFVAFNWIEYWSKDGSHSWHERSDKDFISPILQ